MTVAGIMQPYFFPYLGYFSLIRNVDRFILFDPVQYIRRGWINRNRVLKQGEGWLYIQVPVESHSHTTIIRDVRINHAEKWRSKILSQLAPYKRIAPFYWKVAKLVEEAMAGDHEDIVSLNKATLEAVCRYLGFPRELEIFSRMGLAIDEPHAADEWALNICKALGDVTEYWNPPGGESFFDPKKYEDAGIALRFHKVHLTEYDQGRQQPFEAGLSIIDVLMFNSPERVVEMLDDYELITPSR